MDSDLVRFVCRAKVHLDADGTATGAIVSPVTINDGTWAYCPAGAGSDHDWEAIDPVSGSVPHRAYLCQIRRAD